MSKIFLIPLSNSRLMANIHDIESYVNSDARNKIVLCETHIDGLQYINLGLEMCKIIGSNPDAIEQIGISTVHRQVMNRFEHDDVIGQYLAIDNIGILFEEGLRLNLDAVFEQYSTNLTLVICADGTVKNGVFYYLGDCQCKIALPGRPYIITKKEIQI